jgi:formamidopyrimidine-DNA glycosylase
MKQNKGDFKLRRVTTKTVTLLSQSTQQFAYAIAKEDASSLGEQQATYILTGTHLGTLGFMVRIGHLDMDGNLRWVEIKIPKNTSKHKPCQPI